MAHVYVHILTWNDLRYLPDLFASIEKQTLKDYTLRILDNGSSDGTLDYLSNHFPRAVVGRNTKNVGFSGGHNQLMKFTLDHLPPDANDSSTYVLVANSDMIWSEDVLEKLVSALDANVELAAVQPKLYRAFAEQDGDGSLIESTKSDILDTTGLHVQKGYRMSDRGAGELDEGQYDEQTDIFGVTGTMSLYRLSALKSIAHSSSEFFDQDFFAYKEDCDLAWRLKRFGWKSAFVPFAQAHHYRGMYGAQKQSLLTRIKNRRGQRPFFAAISTRNQLLMLLKNTSISDLIRYSPWLLIGEGLRVCYGFIFESATRKRLLQIPRLLPKMRKKRAQIFSQVNTPDSEIRSYVE